MNFQKLTFASVVLMALVMLNCGYWQSQREKGVSPPVQAERNKEGASDSPITVGDGSMAIESEEPLRNFRDIPDDEDNEDTVGIIHPAIENRIGQVLKKKEGGGYEVKANCLDYVGRCRIVLVWGDGANKKKLIISTDRRGRGMILQARNTKVSDFPGKYGHFWSQPVDQAFKEARFKKPDGTKIDLCSSGEACTLLITFCVPQDKKCTVPEE